MSRPGAPASALPEALRLAWWGTAWLRGEAVTDLVLDAVIEGDATHVVAGLDGASDAADTLVIGLGRLRAQGATMLGAAFPGEGDPVGLGGPAPFNEAAIEVGSAVVSDAGLGVVPRRVGAAITWHAYEASRRQVPDLGEADRTLRAALLDATNTLADLDVARWRPEVADRLMNLRRRSDPAPAPGVPPRCVDLAMRGLQAAEIADLALEDDGGAITAYEITARRDALMPLIRASRRALTAAGSPDAWPDAWP